MTTNKVEILLKHIKESIDYAKKQEKIEFDQATKQTDEKLYYYHMGLTLGHNKLKNELEYLQAYLEKEI